MFASFILLDRSGSMVTRWDDTLGAVNAYAKTLVDGGQGDALITVAMFDSGGFDVIRGGVTANEYNDIAATEAHPRGGTPLLDACVKVAAKINETTADRKALLVLTDGCENASHEVTKAQAKAAFDELRKAGVEITFIGADFDAFSDANSLGVSAGSTLSTQGSGGLTRSIRNYANKSVVYGATGQSMTWTDEDREDAK